MPSSHAGLVRLIGRQRLQDPRIVEAFRALDRAGFVPSGYAGNPYADAPVGLPEGQTTSQPSLIANMIDSVSPGPEDSVLEVGTGYGFQTALLAHLSKRVVSIERWPALAEAARANLEKNGIVGADVIVGDGHTGWEPGAPYDCMIVSAAATELPPALGEQLAEGGRLVIPIKSQTSDEVRLFRKQDGALREVRLVTPARFVPLVRDEDTRG
ncbi:MAG: protein-L-isoaspartate(D-aspartate) O-methyltransferase [Actinomycetota bacterium]